MPKPGPLTPEQQAQINLVPQQGFDTFSNTAGPDTADVERDTATGARLDGGFDPEPITARQALGLDQYNPLNNHTEINL